MEMPEDVSLLFCPFPSFEGKQKVESGVSGGAHRCGGGVGSSEPRFLSAYVNGRPIIFCVFTPKKKNFK